MSVNLVIRQSVYIEVPDDDYIDFLWELVEPDQLDEDTVIMSFDDFLDEFIFDTTAEMRLSKFPGLYDWFLEIEDALGEVEGESEDIDLVFHRKE